MDTLKETAVIYCEGAFNTKVGKTAHGLIMYTERYRISAVIDSIYQGLDSGFVLNGKPNGIPIVQNLDDAFIVATKKGDIVSNFILGISPEGGRLPDEALQPIVSALKAKLNIISGLHDFLSDDEYLVKLASNHGCDITDIRKPPDRNALHFFSGKIEKVKCPRIAILGTDSAIGKRTTAWCLTQAFRKVGFKVEMIGTGQTAWLQGAKYSIVTDSLVNDFVAGEIEHAIHEAWINEKPDLLILEGQGSLLNPAYPGGLELIAAGRPDYIILQHAPRRKYYNGFSAYPIQEIQRQIAAIEILSGKKVIAITISHEGMSEKEIKNECRKIVKETGLPAFDILEHGATKLMELVKTKIKNWDPGSTRIT
jgi:uncharacterized NAD-dependent epimerase/dehydratase family protein